MKLVWKSYNNSKIKSFTSKVKYGQFVVIKTINNEKYNVYFNTVFLDEFEFVCDAKKYCEDLYNQNKLSNLYME